MECCDHGLEAEMSMNVETMKNKKKKKQKKKNEKKKKKKKKKTSYVIYDEREQVHVCTKCGQQLPSYASWDNYITPGKWSMQNNSHIMDVVESRSWTGSGQTVPTNSPTALIPKANSIVSDIMIDLLERVCGNRHVAKCIEEEALAMLRSDKYLKLQCGRSTSDRSLCAYALYNAALKHDAARSVDTIASWFDTSPASVWKLDKKCDDYSERKLIPSDCLELARQNLHASYSEARIVGELADSMFTQHTCAPKTILAACFYSVLGRTGGRGIPSLRACAKACQVSPTSVGRLHRKITAAAAAASAAASSCDV